MKYTLFLFLFFLSSSFLSIQGDPYGFDGKIFYLQNAANEKYLEGNSQVNRKSKTNVEVWPAGVEAGKKWRFEYIKKGKLGGLYLIINQEKELGKYKYLEVSSYEVGTNGGKIQLWEKHDKMRQEVYGNNQLWQVHKNNDGTFSIASAHDKSDGTYVMEVPKSDLSRNGTKVQLYWNRGHKHQKWNIKPISD